MCVSFCALRIKKQCCFARCAAEISSGRPGISQAVLQQASGISGSCGSHPPLFACSGFFEEGREFEARHVNHHFTEEEKVRLHKVESHEFLVRRFSCTRCLTHSPHSPQSLVVTPALLPPPAHAATEHPSLSQAVARKSRTPHLTCSLDDDGFDWQCDWTALLLCEESYRGGE